MRRVCLTLPTNRLCPDTLVAVSAEAAYGAREFGAEVHLLVLDSADASARDVHRKTLAALPAHTGVVVHHLDETAQHTFLAKTAAHSGTADPDRLVALMLPEGVSYGACTNRAFLIAESLGCSSVHRRDSDSSYQQHNGAPVFPLEHELAHLGERAGAVRDRVSSSRLDPALADRPVALVGGSFIGPMSVDLDEIRSFDPAVYETVVTLSVPDDAPPLWKPQLVANAFCGGGDTPFTGDRTTLARVSPAHVDMCNVALTREVYGRLPLPPARETIGSDYFLLHAVYGARLPGVLHNRHIVNHHTPERRTDAGFLAYQVRLAKFFLAVPRLHRAYAAMTAAGPALVDGAGGLRTETVTDLVRAAVHADRAADMRRLDTLDGAFRSLGGRWTGAADFLRQRRADLLNEAQADMAEFVQLLEAWPALTKSSGEQGSVNNR
ncbi:MULTISPECIES: DUF6271 family protein [unclassified Streptomyces]|uniref:DUF6271 family protein n=1 Tax=unclassified Streptomyces TaxID=2593676 RepID=UPI000362FCDD|nr:MULTISPECIES: DUF6271 family protein [unclassified Streptomyces]MYQ76045.1 hypothetical protein [Streptomyces sp. SID4923]